MLTIEVPKADTSVSGPAWRRFVPVFGFLVFAAVIAGVCSYLNWKTYGNPWMGGAAASVAYVGEDHEAMMGSFSPISEEDWDEMLLRARAMEADNMLYYRTYIRADMLEDGNVYVRTIGFVFGRPGDQLLWADDEDRTLQLTRDNQVLGSLPDFDSFNQPIVTWLLLTVTGRPLDWTSHVNEATSMPYSVPVEDSSRYPGGTIL